MRGARVAAAAAACALALGGCQTATVTLLSNEDNATVGAVAVLDPKTERERGVVNAADTVAKTGSRKITPRKSTAGGFAALLGRMPHPVFERELEFVTDTTTVTPESQQALTEILQVWTKAKAVSDIEIIGYADSTGTPADDLELSLARATAVQKLLENQGLEFTADNSEVVGRGDVDALADHGPGVADPKYRKVTVRIR